MALSATPHINVLSQFVFDFFNPTAGISTGAGGHTVTATSGTFPAVVGNGIAMSMFFGTPYEPDLIQLQPSVSWALAVSTPRIPILGLRRSILASTALYARECCPRTEPAL